jgi:hypothetical protein
MVDPGSNPIALSIHCGVRFDTLTRLHHHLRRRTVDILLEPYPSIQLDTFTRIPDHESEGWWDEAYLPKTWWRCGSEDPEMVIG